jgi:hypothetical protein
MSTPQKRYWEWKESQGLPVQGIDVTDGDTVQRQPITPIEDAIRCSTLVYQRLQKLPRDN